MSPCLRLRMYQYFIPALISNSFNLFNIKFLSGSVAKLKEQASTDAV